MSTIDYCYISLFTTIAYLVFLLSQRKFRLLLPSVVYTFIWAVTSFLMICQITGFLVGSSSPDRIFSESARYAMLLIFGSIVGFSLAHILANSIQYKRIILVDGWKIDLILKRFQWIPYLCGIIGIILILFFISVAGGIESLGDYRTLALTTKRIGYMELVQRISGHINFLGTFYLMLLGYRYGQTGLNLKKFFLFFILCSAINIAIAGRGWILSSTLPFLITFVFSRKYSKLKSKDIAKSDKKKITIILLILISLFSIIGQARNETNPTYEKESFVRKFFYLTDGPRMTNLVLQSYPEDTYEKEYGKATLAGSFIESPMTKKFSDSISHDIGLSVTVKSYMPPLYYDFGIIGSVIFWMILCCIFEYWAIKLMHRRSIFSILMFGQISMMLFSTPVGNVLTVYTPAFEWLLIIYLLRNFLFSIPKIPASKTVHSIR